MFQDIKKWFKHTSDSDDSEVKTHKKEDIGLFPINE